MIKKLIFLFIICFISCDQNKTNQSKLQGEWINIRIQGNPINRMVRVPKIEINLSEMRVNGNDGCNSFFGDISEVTNEKIILERLGSTRKMCPDMSISDQFLNVLNHVESYSFEKEILVFKNNKNNEVLAFKQNSNNTTKTRSNE